MAKKALVTGSPERVEAVAAALEQEGFEVQRSDRLDRSADLGTASFDCYVQLPAVVSAQGATTVERVHAFLCQGLLGRYEAAMAAAPAIADGGCVVLAAGNRPAYETGPDAQYARTSLLNVLANALQADLRGRDVRVETVEAGYSPSAIAQLATKGRPSKTIDIADYAPDLDYDEWRLAVLSLDRIEA